MKERWICLILAMLLLGSSIPFSVAESVIPTIESTTLVLENESLALYFVQDYTGFELLDKRNQVWWYSQVQPDQIPEGVRVNKTWNRRSQSLVMINYTDVVAATGNVVMTDMVSGSPVITTTQQEDSFRIDMYFEKLNLGLGLEFSLDENSLLVRIPFDSIVESGANVITRVSLLPFLGSANDWEDGFLLYPNGSGEIFNFKDEKYRSNALSTFTLPVYAPHITQATGFPLGAEADVVQDNSTFVATLPAFGLKKGDAAYAAILEEGDIDSDVVINPGGVSLPVNYAYFNLVYRNNYGSRGQQINVGGSTELSYVSLLTDKDIRAGDRTVRYTFLTAEDANYSGMAAAVRESLQNQGKLKPLEKGLDAQLDIFCGVEQQQVFSKELLTFTTFDQAEQIISFFLNNGLDQLSVNLKGWGSNGVLSYPKYVPAARNLGGDQGLKKLSQYCDEHQISLQLQVNTVKLKDGNKGFLTLTDAARDGNDYIYSIQIGKATYYLQNHEFAMESLNKLREYAQKVGADGLTFEDLGFYMFDDFTNDTKLRTDYVDMWQEQLQYNDAVVGGNACMLGNVSLIREVPESGSMTNLGDETVPFYQMVMHGSVAYTGQPINLFYDDVGQLLLMIEYGYTPCFELTWEGVSRLSATEYQMLFSAKFDTWKDEIAAYAASFAELNDAVGTRKFTEHTKLTENVHESVFEGVRIRVNYGDQEELGVPAGGWLIIKDGE